MLNVLNHPLCLMFSIVHFAQNYAGIIGGSLAKIGPTKISQARLILAENFAKLVPRITFGAKISPASLVLGS